MCVNLRQSATEWGIIKVFQGASKYGKIVIEVRQCVLIYIKVCQSAAELWIIKVRQCAPKCVKMVQNCDLLKFANVYPSGAELRYIKVR